MRIFKLNEWAWQQKIGRESVKLQKNKIIRKYNRYFTS